MADNTETNNNQTDTNQNSIDELVRIVNDNLNPVNSTTSSSSSTTATTTTRTYTSPLMGTSARAAKRRVDNEAGAVRIEGTDTYNQNLQHHYQNVRQILDDQQQQQSQSSNTDPSANSQQSFNAKRDFFEQRFKTPSSATYDTPPRQQQQGQKTTTTTSSNVQDRTSSSSNESPSVDRVLEQAVELQKLSNLNSKKSDPQVPFIIERTEQYQVFLDASNHEVRRTPSISRTSLIPITKTGHATDLDQAQAQVEGLTDEHQAIQHLSRGLQEHNVTTINEYKRLPSQTNPISTSSTPPPVATTNTTALIDRTNLPIKSEYSVLDALVNNPIGTIDDKQNYLLTIHSNDICANLRNPEYLNTLKQQQQQPAAKSTKKPKKEKKTKEKKVKTQTSDTTGTVEELATGTPIVNNPKLSSKQITKPTIEPAPAIVTTIPSDQTPLIDKKDKKKQDKENKKQKQKQPKTKSKQKSKNDDYQVLDAIIGSPIVLRLPDSYLIKYNLSPPLSHLSLPLQFTPTSTTTQPPPPTTTTAASSSQVKPTPITDKNQTLYHLVKIVNELREHHAAAVADSLNRTPLTSTKQSEPLTQQQRSFISSNQQTTEVRPQSESVKPRVIYRYMDENGRVLQISSTPPTKLREQPAQDQPNRNIEPPYLYGRHIAINDERIHSLPQYEQQATWQGEPKLPTTVTREDFELQDRRIPHLVEQSIPTTRTVPVNVEHERSSRNSSQQHQQSLPSRVYHYPNQQNVKLAWLPLSYPSDQQYLTPGTAGYDTDSTISERSTTYRPYEYAPNDYHYRYTHRPLNYEYHNRSPGPSYYPPVSHTGRGISPEYGGASRNYIEVFRGGDFRDTKPSEIYSLPLTEHIRTSPISPATTRHSRYDQYQSERYNTMLNRSNNNIPSSLSPSQQQQQPSSYYYSNTLPNTRYQQNIPSPSTVYTSSYYTPRNPTVQSSPLPEYSNYIRQSKSFDYRPLRTKLQREYKITPNLLVDEWDYPQVSDNTKYSTTTTTTTHRSTASTPDDVFINNSPPPPPPSTTTTNKA